jgi:hypothetical protein
VHQNHEIHALTPGRLLAVGIKDTETASKYYARYVLDGEVTAGVECGEIQTVVFEVRETAVDDSGEYVMLLGLEEYIADAVADVHAAFSVEDIVSLEHQLLPRACLEEWVLCARAEVRERIHVQIGLCGGAVIYCEHECLDFRRERDVALIFVYCKIYPHHITLLEDFVRENALLVQI